MINRVVPHVLPEVLDTPLDSTHYLRAVTDMADQCAVVAHQAIYTDQQIKLVEKGMRIDSRLYDRLVQHKLSTAIDDNLTVENKVDIAALVAVAQTQCETQTLPLLLVEAIGGANHLLAPLRAVPLTEPIAFKLTVMREQHPDLYIHSIQMVLVAVFLGLRSKLPERNCVVLAAAALLHDLGALYMGPVWRDPDYKAEGLERTHLVAHPVTAMLLIRSQKIYPASIEKAVLEHHERMDGSGYPRGLMGEQISPMGRILLLAEVVTAFYEKYTDIPAQRLSLVLRLNHRKFPADLAAHILRLLPSDTIQEAENSAMQPLAENALAHIDILGQAFDEWARLRTQTRLPTPPSSNAIASASGFLDVRLSALEKALIEAGAHPRQQAQMVEQLQGDTQGLAEIALVGREALWQLHSIVHGCQRYFAQSSDQADTPAAQWCDWMQPKMP